MMVLDDTVITDRRVQFAEVFRDTQAFYKENRLLSKAADNRILSSGSSFAIVFGIFSEL